MSRSAPIRGVAAAILAGGVARRLGGVAKALLEVDGRPILDRQLDVLRPLLAEILVVAEDPAPFTARGLRVVPDVLPGRGGPLVGVLSALEAAAAARVVLVACDMPDLRSELVRLVATAGGPDADLAVPVVGGLPEPLLARYGRACVPALRARLAAGRLQAAGLLEEPGLRVVRVDEAALRAVDPELASFRNVNTPEDLARASRASRADRGRQGGRRRTPPRSRP